MPYMQRDAFAPIHQEQVCHLLVLCHVSLMLAAKRSINVSETCWMTPKNTFEKDDLSCFTCRNRTKQMKESCIWL